MESIDVESVDVAPVGIFDFRRVGDDYLLANDFGDWLFLSSEDFTAFLDGRLDPEGAVHAELRDGNFLSAHLDEKSAIEKLKRRYRCLNAGPSTFQFALNREAIEDPEGEGDLEAGVMTHEVIERALDLAFMSTEQKLDVEIGGANPLEAWAELVHLVEYANQRNRLAMKAMSMTLFSDLNGLDEEKEAWLIEHDIGLRALISTDTMLEGKANVIDRLASFNQAGAAAGEAYTSGAAEILLTCTPRVLGAFAQVVDTAVEAGCRAVRLMTFNPEDISAEDDGGTGCELGAYLVFYGDVLDAMLQKTDAAAPVVESGASAYLKRILEGDHSPGFELRNPTVDGIDRHAFNVDGYIFTSDEGRIVFERRADPMFMVGHVTRTGYRELVTHQTIRVLLIASVLECQPGWSTSPYKIFAGSSPVRSYLEHGSVHGNMMDSPSAYEQLGVLDCLFERIADADEEMSRRLRVFAEVAS